MYDAQLESQLNNAEHSTPLKAAQAGLDQSSSRSSLATAAQLCGQSSSSFSHAESDIAEGGAAIVKNFQARFQTVLLNPLRP